MSEKCEHPEYTTRHRARGIWTETRDRSGRVLEANNDDITVGPEPKTATCDYCGKRFPNPHHLP